MIKKDTGQKAEKAVSNQPLPAGGYVAKIKSAKIEDYSWGSVVVIAFDIAEGDFKGFFKKQFDANPNEDKKWKGTYRLTVPDESSQYFESNRKTFNNFIYALEDSNDGYHYDCDEKKFKNKLIGVLFRNREWEMNSNSGWTTECGAVTDIAAIRDGSFKPLKDKPLNNSTPAPSGSAPLTSNDANDILDNDGSGSDDDLPF